MKTPARMEDLRHVETNLSDEEMQECRLAGLRQKEIAELGDRYVLHPKNAPERGAYHPVTGFRLA